MAMRLMFRRPRVSPAGDTRAAGGSTRRNALKAKDNTPVQKKSVANRVGRQRAWSYDGLRSITVLRFP